jgi:AcrR family transcriptional regulator
MSRPLSPVARQKAIEAARAVIAELGINGFTLDGVSRRSGVAKTTLYRHWKTGTALLISALDCGLEQIATPDTGSLGGDLTDLLTTVATALGTPARRRMLLEMSLAATTDPDLALAKQAMVRHRTRPVQQIVRQAIERGEIPDIDLELAATFVQGPVLAWVLEARVAPDPGRIDQLVTLLVRGLGGRRPGV